MKTRTIKLIPIITAAAMFGVLNFGPNDARAGAVGECANCHVMHASELGIGDPNGITGPNATLLRDTCIGCHNDATSAVAPSVMGATNDLSGGDFDNLAASERNGHNPYVAAVIAEDTVLTTDPPGWATGFLVDDPGGDYQPANAGWAAATNGLQCSGEFGCHGDRSSGKTALSAMVGSHHVNQTGATDGTTLGKSFRFLMGIKGVEDSDWGEDANATNRNVYHGIDRDTAADTVAANQSTISYFCATCHGSFHAGAGALGIVDGTIGTDPWLRHPVDVDMDYNADHSNYDYGANTDNNAVLATIPLGADVTNAAMDTPGEHNTAISTGVAGSRIVTCLSCHMAHASANGSILRWDQTVPRAGQGASNVGCLACHTNVDGTVAW